VFDLIVRIVERMTRNIMTLRIIARISIDGVFNENQMYEKNILPEISMAMAAAKSLFKLGYGKLPEN